MTAYYNENDPKSAAWLRELIKAELIAPGEVDERGIEDVIPTDLNGFSQCHFFAGIGGWSYALRLAGWPDSRPVWTGSCPCQPFSAAGKGKGFADERHLWPAFFHLISQCRPPVVFGEQVASPPGLMWLDLVQTDLEGQGYSVGAADLCAAGVGAPHIRQRLYWMADDGSQRRERWADSERPATQDASERREGLRNSESRGNVGGLADARRNGLRVSGGSEKPIAHQSSHWSLCDVLPCRDGKYRPVEPGTFPLAHGVSGRVGLLRGYGNAIVPQVAAAFIEASM